MEIGKGNLTIIDGHQVFWKGKAVPGVVSVKLNYEDGESQVKVRVNGSDDAMYMDMVTAGVIVKKGK